MDPDSSAPDRSPELSLSTTAPLPLEADAQSADTLPTRPVVTYPASTGSIPMASPTMISTTSSSSSIPASSPSAIDPTRRPTATLTTRGSGLNVTPDIQARLKALHLGRQGAPPSSRLNSTHSESGAPSLPANNTPPASGLASGLAGGLRLANGKPIMSNLHSAPAVPGVRMPLKQSLAEKRGLALPTASGQSPSPRGATPVARKRPGLTLSQMSGGSGANSNGGPADETKPTGGTMLDRYSEFLDAKTGTLQFKGKAILNSQGVQFADNSAFSISLNEVDTLDELGKGNYGTVYKVRHSRPKVRVPGMGLAGNKSSHLGAASMRKSSDGSSPTDSSSSAAACSGTTGAIMAMKEIRLELDDAKFAAIIMELDVLHRCVSPYIIDFYGAFFQEGAVYICMEFMDGGSIDKLYGDGIPENVLRQIAYSTTMGLKSLKEDHNIIHRDVKPTNILINTRGQIKICDFGVSGNLVASFAKTNIGCQSYMAPERISSGGMSMPGGSNGTYSVQSDIWSLGLTLIECALGRYPYPPETYTNIFSQLSAIVDGDPPDLPQAGYSETARNFIHSCLNKVPKLRPSYPMLLQHPWLAPLAKPNAIIEEDEEEEESQHLQKTPSSENETPTTEDSLGSLSSSAMLPDNVVDPLVALWVAQALEKRRQGKMNKSQRPALDAAPLDAVPPANGTAKVEGP